jgi:oligo-1,6-glucosidase
VSSQPWWQQAVVYQVWPRSYADSDGNGVGDLGGVMDKLDYLARLGIDVLWLSPFYPSPQHDYGYDISDYQAVDPQFGTLEQFDALVAAAHERGIRVIIDVVLNHTSFKHPWFQESRSSPDSPKRDWYWWRDTPNNWASFFSVPAWTWDEQAGAYYLNLFAPEQPDLNWENPEVRHALYAMLRWWLDRGVDGFRMDVINLVSKQTDLPDGPVPPGQTLGDGFAFVANGPRIHEFLHEMHEQVYGDRERIYLTVGEMPGSTVSEARLYTDPARAEVDMVFQFEHMSLDHGPKGKYDLAPLDLRDLKANFRAWTEGLAGVGWNSLYWNNHDQPRIVSRWGDDGEHRVRSAKALGTLLHLHPGTPYIYMGEELGMTNYPFSSLDEVVDVEGVRYAEEAAAAGEDPEAILAAVRARGRDNARSPMQWDDSPNGGFTTGTPWFPVNPNYRSINAASQVDDPDSVFHHYRALIALRHDEPAVVHGDFTMLLPEDPQVYAFTRRLASTELLVLVNVSGEPAVAEIPDTEWAHAEVVLGGPDPTLPIMPSPPGTIGLQPWEHRVLRRPVDR